MLLNLKTPKSLYLYGLCLLTFTILEVKTETSKDTYSFNNDSKSIIHQHNNMSYGKITISSETEKN